MSSIVLYGKVVNDKSRIIPVEIDISGSLISISHQHSQVHQGTYFTVSHLFSAVSAGADAELLVRFPAGVTGHMVMKVSAGADATVQLFEAPTASADGTAITPINHNRQSTNTADSTAFYGPTITDDGTRLHSEFLPGGGILAPGAILTVNTEQFVLAAGSDYLFRVTNDGAGAENISIDTSYYEVPLG